MTSFNNLIGLYRPNNKPIEIICKGFLIMTKLGRPKPTIGYDKINFFFHQIKTFL